MSSCTEGMAWLHPRFTHGQNSNAPRLHMASQLAAGICHPAVLGIFGSHRFRIGVKSSSKFSPFSSNLAPVSAPEAIEISCSTGSISFAPTWGSFPRWMSLGLDRLDRKNPPGSTRILANSESSGGPGRTSHRSEEFPPQSAYLRWQVVDEQKAFGCPPNRGEGCGGGCFSGFFHGFFLLRRFIFLWKMEDMEALVL